MGKRIIYPGVKSTSDAYDDPCVGVSGRIYICGMNCGWFM